MPTTGNKTPTRQREGNHPVHEADVVIYGGTSAGVAAAAQVAKMGMRPLIVTPEKRLGGMSSSGLGFTDTGDKSVIGGLAREFYHRLWLHYSRDEEWRWEKREEFGNRGQGTPAIDGAMRTIWVFEPAAAEAVFESWIREWRVPVYRGEWLDRENGVEMEGNRVTSIRTLSGKVFRGGAFLDCTYEGDLMAAAGVPFHVGREGNEVYGETWNGIQTGVLHHRHHFGVLPEPISPYRVPGDPSSGLLRGISAGPPGDYGRGDHRVQAYNFRLCLTDHPDNRVPFPKPGGYDPWDYELLLRVFAAGWRETFQKFDRLPNRKTDTNNHGPVSTDFIGENHGYPEAGYEKRRQIQEAHERYQKGWFYFIANDPRVPVEVGAEMRKWGLAADEFTDNGNWPEQLYVREARRMLGSHVMTENELTGRRPTPEPVGMGSYTIDSHNARRYVTPEGHVQNEGDIGVRLESPYAISRGSLIPPSGGVANLVVPVCVSSSHIAFGSIRMEPVFMILGQSAATAAVLALRSGVAQQDLPYPELRRQLLADGQVLPSG